MSTRAKRTCESRADIFSLCESEGGARAHALDDLSSEQANYRQCERVITDINTS